jgi:hypothetical protein
MVGNQSSRERELSALVANLSKSQLLFWFCVVNGTTWARNMKMCHLQQRIRILLSFYMLHPVSGV